MILHLLSDEKFVDYVIDIFEKASSGSNDYLIPYTESKELNYVTVENTNVIRLKIDSNFYQSIVDNCHKYKLIIVHNFYDEYKKELVPLIPGHIHIHWMCWGTDLYSIPQLNTRLISKASKSLLSKQNKSEFFIKLEEFLINKLPFLWDKISLFKGNRSGFISYKKVIKKIDSFSTVIPSEGALIKKYFNINKQYTFKYATIENSLLKDNDPICSLNNFLIGNSSTITNNHIDVIDLLIQNQINQKIHIPMSYGDIEYRKKIESYIYSKNSDNFIIYKDFLSKHAYNKILLTCGNVVMNHYRQQGLGTILIALWNGSRVFLNKRNPLYYYLSSLGLELFKLEDIPNYNELSTFDSLAKINRPILKTFYNENRVVQETEKLLQNILN